MGLCSVPQTRELTASSTEPVPVPCIGNTGAAVPWVEGAADLPMEGEDKAPGG